MCTYKVLRGIEELEKLDLIEPSSREAIERIVRSVKLQLRLQSVTLSHSLVVLLDVAERASKLLGSPQSLAAERREFPELRRLNHQQPVR